VITDTAVVIATGTTTAVIATAAVKTPATAAAPGKG